MRNEYNMKLDGNGYAKSILQEGSCCHLCGHNGSMDKLDRHEVFGGPDRAKSKRYGLWVLPVSYTHLTLPTILLV